MPPGDLFEGLQFPAHPTYRPHRLPDGRELSIPEPELRGAQKALLRRLQRLARPSPQAYAVRGRGPVRHALRHAARSVVVTADIRDFFNSLGVGHVSAALQPLLGAETAQVLASCLNGVPPRLPQGAPTSPFLAELCMVGLDQRLAQAARNTGWRYTRYVDDLAWSAPMPRASLEVEGLLLQAAKILAVEYLQLNEEKTRVMRSGQRQEVLGLIVNKAADGALGARPGRQRKRKLRQLEQRGLAEAAGVKGYRVSLETANRLQLWEEAFE